ATRRPTRGIAFAAMNWPLAQALRSAVGIESVARPSTARSDPARVIAVGSPNSRTAGIRSDSTALKSGDSVTGWCSWDLTLTVCRPVRHCAALIDARYIDNQYVCRLSIRSQGLRRDSLRSPCCGETVGERSGDGASALEGAAQCHLVRVLEVAAHGQAGGQAGHRDA